MAVVKLADVYEPLTFESAVNEQQIELNRFLVSGIVVENPMITAQAMAGGTIGELPFYKKLDNTNEPDYVNDDDTEKSVPQKVTSGKMIWRVAKMHGSWSTMDFARELALTDPLGHIVNSVAKWWAVQKERRLIQSCVGLYLDNVDANSSDMVHSIYSDVASPAATNIINAEAVLDARQTRGDRSVSFGAIAMHSVTYNNLNKQNLIEFIPNARGEIIFAYYLQMIVIVDDSLPVIAGTNSPAYLTILFESGAFEHGSGQVLVPSELERDASSGNGGGQDIIHSRSADIYHPYGYQFTSASVADESATLAELALPANWTRVASDRKMIGMAFLLHNN